MHDEMVTQQVRSFLNERMDKPQAPYLYSYTPATCNIYMTYNTKQFSNYKQERVVKFQGRARVSEGLHRYAEPPKKIPQVIPKSTEFIPDRLVRVSDMKVIEGKDAKEGYCTLSYAFKQSGEITVEENSDKLKRIDEGKHRIIFPAKTIRVKPRGRKRLPPKIKYVTFEGLIQHICQDFNIKYIWYDQLCIDQDNLTEKCKTIRQIHQIYRHAYCTVALVPELTTVSHKTEWHLPRHNAASNTLLKSLWMKRMWTLAEASMSQRLLFVALKALPNKKYNDNNDNEGMQDMMPIQGYNLPSWTGIGGEHQAQEWITPFENEKYSIHGSIMQIECSGISGSNITTYAAKERFILSDQDIPPLPPGGYDKNGNLVFWELVVQIQLPGDTSGQKRLVYVGRTAYSPLINNHLSANMFVDTLERLSHFLPIKKEDLQWVRTPVERKQLGEENRPRFSFSNLIENTEFQYDAHYVILCGMPFYRKKFWFLPSSYRNYYPVLKKENGSPYFKTIGLCNTENVQDFFVDYHPNEQVFKIQ
ncbi:hypothetical protein BDA99DRAFT_539801 [Phascolomyces articulosus]|uniref:Heterokaryon incompatibility domain-containing protein n=1 Tax=Phascolomyces articulosus TaxID=60185 RepID=A0AAD5K4J9_9FUNG|nr:hypothetical protein BDA99DRAFT_539801 [Phascolomyces articulosus]